MRAPVFETPARLGWRLNHGEIIFYPDAPAVICSMTPVFPGCSDKLAERGIVWDIEALLASARCPGAHFILNAECGYPSDADLDEAVLVSHPDDETVVWELDIQGLSPALDDRVGVDGGFIRLLFSRRDYEADLRAMLREIRRTAQEPVAVSQLSGAYNGDVLVANYPKLEAIGVDCFEPARHGDRDWEGWVRMLADATWPRVPVLPAGSRLEIGFFGEHLYRLDGRVQHGWLGRWFTRWAVLEAFRQWLEPAGRAFALPMLNPDMKAPEGVGPNTFVLLPGQDEAACHQAGEAFAVALQHAFREGSTAPDVSVSYLRRDLSRA